MDWTFFFTKLIGLILSILNIYTIIIVVRVVVSWVGMDPYNPFVQFLARLTDPLFAAIRRRLPAALWSSGLDFSPLVAVLVIQLVSLLLQSIRI